MKPSLLNVGFKIERFIGAAAAAVLPLLLKTLVRARPISVEGND